MGKPMAKLTLKQERFCRKYHESGNGAESYRTIYDTESDDPQYHSRKAKVELDKGNIRARLAELEEDALIEHSVTIGGLIKDYRKGFEVSEIKENGAAMKANVDGIAKITGLLVDKVESKDTTTPVVEFIHNEVKAN